MCVDFRILNLYMARDNHSPLIIEDYLDLLEGKRYFSLLDLKNGFYHVRVADESVKYMAFVTPLDQYKYLRMSFGLKPVPARFTQHINRVLKELIESGEVVAYMTFL